MPSWWYEAELADGEVEFVSLPESAASGGRVSYGRQNDKCELRREDRARISREAGVQLDEVEVSQQWAMTRAASRWERWCRGREGVYGTRGKGSRLAAKERKCTARQEGKGLRREDCV